MTSDDNLPPLTWAERAEQRAAGHGTGPKPFKPEDGTPPLTSTILITLFFGVFGVIPASLHTSRARDKGVSTSKYWKAFGWTMAASVAAWVLLLVILTAAVSSSVNSAIGDYNSVTSAEALPTVAGPPVGSPAATGPDATSIAQYLSDVRSDSRLTDPNRYSDDQLVSWAKDFCVNGGAAGDHDSKLNAGVYMYQNDTQDTWVLSVIEDYAASDGMCS